jgi:hypothetical protein
VAPGHDRIESARARQRRVLEGGLEVAEREGRRDFWSARENGGIPRLDPENFHHGRGEKAAVSPMQAFIVPILEISFTSHLHSCYP